VTAVLEEMDGQLLWGACARMLWAHCIDHSRVSEEGCSVSKGTHLHLLCSQQMAPPKDSLQKDPADPKIQMGPQVCTGFGQGPHERHSSADRADGFRRTTGFSKKTN